MKNNYHDAGHTTNMAAMPIHGKTLYTSTFQEPVGILTKHGM